MLQMKCVSTYYNACIITKYCLYTYYSNRLYPKRFQNIQRFFFEILNYIKGVRTHIKILCDTNDSPPTVYRYVAIHYH